MKLKYISILSLISAIFITQNAKANLLIDPYVGIAFGTGGQTIFTDEEDKSKSVQSYIAVVGIDIPILRFELEYDYITNDKSKINLGMANVYAKLPTAILKPYIGAGIGSTFDSDMYDIEIESTTAYQGMLGVTLDIPVLPIDLDAEARVLYAPKIYTINDITSDLLQYDLRIKARYVF